MIAELELYKPTRIFEVSKMVTFSILIALLISIPFVNKIGEGSEKYILPFVILLAISTLLALIVKKYYNVGTASCDGTSITIRLINGHQYLIKVEDILYAKINVLGYRGRSAGLTGLTASGVENLMLIKYPNVHLKFYYYINDINERRKLQQFFNGWRELNKNILVAY